MNNNQKTTKEIYEEFYKKPIEEITCEDIGEGEVHDLIVPDMDENQEEV